MRLAILSRSAKIYSTRRLAEAARARGIRVRVLDPLACEMLLDGTATTVFYKRKPFGRVDAVIPRIAPSISHYGLAVVNALELKGVVVVNTAQAIAQSRNKVRCLQLLSGAGIAIPPTVMAADARDLKEMIPLVGGVPVLVKLLQGGEKQGVMICETTTSLEASMEAILGLGQNLLVQEYVRDASGKDLRALVVGGQLVCAVRRMARPGRLSRTLGKGAAFEAVQLPASYERVAVEAARIVGLEVAAVDLLDHDGGPRVFEVNSSPSLKELEDASGLDIAGRIVEHAVELVHRAKAEAGQREPLAEPPPPLELPVPPPPTAAPAVPVRRRRGRKAPAGRRSREPRRHRGR